MEVTTTAAGPVYRYRAALHRVIDGDTYELAIDLGFKVTLTVPCRLYGYSCAERRAPGGAEAALVALDVLDRKALIIESYKGKQTFARWLVTIWIGPDNVGALLEQRGVASRTP